MRPDPSRLFPFVTKRALSRGVLSAIWLAPVALTAGSSWAQAPTAVASTTKQVLASFPNPVLGRIAVNSAGDALYVNTPYYGNSTVNWLPRGAATPIVLATTTNSSTARNAFVDSNNNLFVPNLYAGNVLEFPYVNGSYATVANVASLSQCTSFTPTSACLALGSSGAATGYYYQPVDMGFDAAGNAYVLDAYSNGNCVANCIVKFTRNTDGTYGYTTSVLVSSLSASTASAEIAVDPAGDVFYVNGTLLESISAGTTNAKAFGIGFTSPTGVSTDSQGNLFVSNSASPYGLFAFPATNGVVQTGTQFLVLGTYTSGGAGVNLSGDAYFAGYSGGATLNMARLNSFAFAATPVGQSAGSLAITFTFDKAVSIDAPSSQNVLTNGAPNLDFRLGTGSTCAGAFVASTTCTMSVLFSPTTPGQRTGAVNLTSGGAVLATAYITGVGTGPQLAFSPAVQSTVVGSGLNNPVGVAVDGSGNVYIVNRYNSSIFKETLSGSGSYTQSTVGSGLYAPYSVAVDGAGNLYIADASNNRVVKETLSTSGSYVQSVVASGLNYPAGVAVDSSGNVYIADSGDGRVLKETLSVAGSYVQTTVVGQLNVPFGVAVDSSGNLYITETNSYLLLKETLASSGGYAQSTIGSGLKSPFGVAVDGSGNVYVADTDNNRVLKETLSATGSYTQSTVGSGLNAPFNVAVDGSGNVYIADSNNGRLLKEDFSDPPSLNFGNVSIGSSSATQTVTLTNGGNAPLSFPPPSTGQNPSLSAPYNYSNGSSCPQLSTMSSGYLLGIGNSCTATLSVTPTAAGTQSGQLVFTDNNLNPSASTTQTLQLTAVAYQITITPVAGTLPNGTYGQNYSQTFTASGGSSSSYTYSVPPSSLPPGLSITSSGVLSGTPTAAGSFNFTVTANDSNNLSGNQTYTLTVNPATPAVTVNSSSANYGASTAPLSASIAFTGATAPTGAVTFTVNNTMYLGSCTSTSTVRSCSANAAVSSLPAGTYTVAVTESADTNYTAASNTGTLSINAATPSVTINNPVSTTYGTAATTLSASVAYSGASAPTGTVTFTLNGVLYTGMCNAPSASPRTCTASANTSTLAAGSYSYGVSETADSNYTVSSATATFSVTAATPSVTVVPVSVVYGTQSATLSANVAYTGSAAPTGAFTFIFNGGTYTASCMNGASSRSCTATVPTATLNPGSYVITANQAADSNYGAASNTGTLSVTTATPTVTGVTVSTVYGTATTQLSANIAYMGNTAPSGAVIFALNGASYTAACSTGASPRNCTVNATTSVLAAGSYTFTVSEAADSNYTVASGMGTLNVTAATPMVTATSASVVYGAASAMLSASVAYTGSTAPTGAVTFTFNGSSYNAICTPASSSPRNCSATVTTSSLVAGAYTITVSEAADTNYALTSNTGTLTITMATPLITTTSSSVVYGSSTATLSANIAFSGSTAPSGAVTFAFNGANYTGTCNVSGSTRSCTAAVPVSTLTVGSYNYTVLEAADTNYAVATGSGTVSVTAAGATVSAKAASAILGSPTTTLSAAIAYGGSLAPTGAVTFTLNSANYTGVCSASAGTRSCTATVPTSALAVGSYIYTVSEAADSNYATASGAATLAVVIAPDFAFTGTGPTYQTVIPGNSVSFTYNLSPTYSSFPGTVTFTVTGLPPGATYSITPSTVAATGVAQTVTLTVQTAKPLGAKNEHSAPWSRGIPFALAALLFPFCARKRMRKDILGRLAMLFLVCASFSTVIALTGCGTGNGFLEQPSTNYTVNVTATSNGVQHAAVVTLNLQ